MDEEKDWQLVESRRASTLVLRIAAALFVGGSAWWLSSFFVDPEAVGTIIFGSGLAVFYLWKGPGA